MHGEIHKSKKMLFLSKLWFLGASKIEEQEIFDAGNETGNLIFKDKLWPTLLPLGLFLCV